MPAYNVDRYVRRAVQSLQIQSFDDFELLVVDDGSSDRTGRILDSLAERDIRIKVFHTANAGAPAARNLALDRAKGKYVMFMDADDWVESDALRDMVDLAEKDQLELVIAAFYIDTYYGDAGEHYSEVKGCPSALYESKQEFRSVAWQLFDQNLFYSPWNKLFLLSRIKELNLRFRPTFMDDFPFVLDYIRDVVHVGVTERPYYHFIRQREESETARWRPNLYEKREEEHGWMLDLYDHWGLSGDPASMEMIQRRYIERLVGCIENVCNPKCTLPAKEKKQLIGKMITTENARVAASMARPRTMMLRAMVSPIKAGNVGLSYNEGKFISFVKRHNTRLFAMLKANR